MFRSIRKPESCKFSPAGNGKAFFAAIASLHPAITSACSKIKQYLPKPFSKKRPPQNPIALLSPFKSNRITAQQGVFTLYGSTAKDLQHYALLKKYLVKIEILRSKVALMKEQLRVAGIATTSVFPELEGLCREVQDYYRYEQETK